MAKKSKVCIPDVVLCDVRHSDLGRSIEMLQDEMFSLEELHKKLRDTDAGSALIIRMVLESVDMLTLDYDEVK